VTQADKPVMPMGMFSVDTDVGQPRSCSEVTSTAAKLTETEMTLRFITIVLGLLSIMATTLVAGLLDRHKVLMSHPNKLIFYMCLAEAICAW